jgi:uncharacterized glyoxalase superfamily protein PhnB
MAVLDFLRITQSSIEVNFFQYSLPGFHYIAAEQSRAVQSAPASFITHQNRKEYTMSKPIPERYHTVTPFLCVQGAAKLIEFVKQVFDATVIERMDNTDGTVKHAEVKIGDSMMMIAESSEQWDPKPGAFYLYVSDADAIYKCALQAGATSLMEPQDTFYGNRESGVKDHFGNLWWIATHKEEVSPEEMQKRFEALAKK